MADYSLVFVVSGASYKVSYQALFCINFVWLPYLWEQSHTKLMQKEVSYKAPYEAQLTKKTRLTIHTFLLQWNLDIRKILGVTKIFLKSRFFLISNTRNPLKKHNILYWRLTDFKLCSPLDIYTMTLLSRAIYKKAKVESQRWALSGVSEAISSVMAKLKWQKNPCANGEIFCRFDTFW